MWALNVVLVIVSSLATVACQEEPSCSDFLGDFCVHVPTLPDGCSDYEEYCAKSCGFCTDQGPNGQSSDGSSSNSSSSTPQETCVDRGNALFCARVKRFSGSGNCDDQDPGVRETNTLFCAKTCGLCTPNAEGQNGTSVNGPNNPQSNGPNNPNAPANTHPNGPSPSDPVANGPAIRCVDKSPAEFCVFMQASGTCTIPLFGRGQGMQLYCAKTCGACEQSPNPLPNGASPNNPVVPVPNGPNEPNSASPNDPIMPPGA